MTDNYCAEAICFLESFFKLKHLCLYKNCSTCLMCLCLCISMSLCFAVSCLSLVRCSLVVSVLDCQSRGPRFKSRPGQTFGSRFLLHQRPLANSAMVSRRHRVWLPS